MISKQKLLLGSGLASAVLLAANYMGTFQLCGAKQYGSCMETLASTIIVLIPILPLFLFSLITYWMPETIYRAWFKFALVWIPLSMLLIFISPEYSSDWMYRIEKGTVAFGMSALFVIISILIIGGMYVRIWIGRKKI